MIHPLIRLIITRPQLLLAHAGSYVALASAQLVQASSHIRRRLVLGVLAGLVALAALVFSGVALMLWAVAAAASLSSHGWVLWAIPGATWLAAAGLGWAATRPGPGFTLDLLKEQAAADGEVLASMSRR